ncbi:hypothetical protein WICPIJ_003843 [Wickerhamomyces pijperi]|uniref:Uncharacterized protein n=1 Tax=Wickerhamomyces pijperi TaxID=599730 RepID=A0A9P8Q8W6_WICPI|nr:hypothetical protein WICPIJ_003843 [Wickerhamomyces pijperi]
MFKFWNEIFRCESSFDKVGFTDYTNGAHIHKLVLNFVRFDTSFKKNGHQPCNAWRTHRCATQDKRNVVIVNAQALHQNTAGKDVNTSAPVGEACNVVTSVINSANCNGPRRAGWGCNTGINVGVASSNHDN